MFKRSDKQEYLRARYLWLWFSLAFLAGAVNAGGFLACARYVSHMTGFGTQVGVSLAELRIGVALEMVTAPLSFLAGAMASAMLVDGEMIFGRPPRYLAVMSGVSLLLAVVTVGGEMGWFGPFGEPLQFHRDFVLMSVLCFACGMQNACFGSLTRGQIRTTHLTGILTDIGVTFVKLVHLPRRSLETRRLQRLNFIRIMTFLSFSTGSAAFAVVFSRIQYAGFAILAILYSSLFCFLAYRQAMVDRRNLAMTPVNAVARRQETK